MKVILVDNYGRETVADVLHAVDLSEEEARSVADQYNAGQGDYAPYFARVVEDDYVLWRGMEELI